MRRLHRISELVSGRPPRAARGGVGGARSRSARSRRGLAGITFLGLLATACEAPRYEAAVTPPDATLQIDGRRQATSAIDAPIPYYGVVAVAGVPRPDEVPSRAGSRTMLRIDEPVTPWIFPFDLPIELVQVMFEPVPPRTVRVDLPRRDDVPLPETQPRGLTEFRARAADATLAR